MHPTRFSVAARLGLSKYSFSVLLCLCLTAGYIDVAYAKHPRDSKVVREFKRENPCPSNGKKRGACPGWIVDHVIPICAGGADHPSNLQWQTRTDAKMKDREEKKQCLTIRQSL